MLIEDCTLIVLLYFVSVFLHVDLHATKSTSHINMQYAVTPIQRRTFASLYSLNIAFTSIVSMNIMFIFPALAVEQICACSELLL